MIDFRREKTVTVRRYKTDKFGDRELVVEFEVPRCRWAPSASASGATGTTDEGDGRSGMVQTDGDLYIRGANPDIEPGDTVDVGDGIEREVIGDIFPWRLGSVVRLRRRRG